MVMLPTLLIIGVPAKLVLWGERVGSSAQCRMATVMHEIAKRDR